MVLKTAERSHLAQTGANSDIDSDRSASKSNQSAPDVVVCIPEPRAACKSCSLHATCTRYKYIEPPTGDHP
ncbi:hypothetical protein C8Q76DRAFT_763712 [Earliella scabrosa]|nr:hypothetical protein C8Q76DRAFT_763712 [Earliella scabrosa]